MAAFGALDVLVNNAGIGGVSKPTHQISEEEWDALMAVNTNSSSTADTPRSSVRHGHVERLYLGYTTCPRCAKAYGKNYVVVIAKVDPPKAV